MNEKDIAQMYTRFAYFCGFLVLLSGSYYMIVQWIIMRVIRDTLFISLSIGASLFIILFVRNIINFILNNGTLFYTSTITSIEPEKSKQEYDKLLKIFTNFIFSVPFGIIWAILAGLLPFYMHIWSNNFTLALSFGIFLFFICFITGYFLFLLISFFIISKKLWNLIDVELWKRESNASEFLMTLSRKTSFVASIYIAICMTAWLSTPLVPVTKELIIYIIFSAILLIASVVIPIRPYTNKLQMMKHNALKDIDEKIQAEYFEILEILRSNRKNADFNQMNLLMDMRKKIEDIQIYPYRIKTITASFTIIIISLVPILMEFILKKFFP